MKRAFVLSAMAIMFVLALFSYGFAEEKITITTYYPSPSGNFNRLFVAGNVGVSNTSPQVKLQIGNWSTGNYPASANNSLAISHASDYLSIIPATIAGDMTQFNISIGDDLDDLLTLGSFGGGGTLTVTGRGNVGIGTITPTRFLDVNAEARLMKGSNPINFTDGWEATPDSVLNVSEISNDTSGFQALMIVGNRSQDYGGGQRYRTVALWDKVGIGTNTPGISYSLYVNGGLAVNGIADKAGVASWGVLSDIRLKEITGTFGYGLTEVLKLEPIRFHYKPNAEFGLATDKEYVGFSAQEVQKIIPDAVRENDKGYLVIESDPILWAMLNAIKEQNKKIEELENRLAEVERLQI